MSRGDVSGSWQPGSALSRGRQGRGGDPTLRRKMKVADLSGLAREEPWRLLLLGTRRVGCKGSREQLPSTLQLLGAAVGPGLATHWLCEPRSHFLSLCLSQNWGNRNAHGDRIKRCGRSYAAPGQTPEEGGHELCMPGSEPHALPCVLVLAPSGGGARQEKGRLPNGARK